MLARELNYSHMGKRLAVRDGQDNYTGDLTSLRFETGYSNDRVGITLTFKRAHAFLHINLDDEVTLVDENQNQLVTSQKGG